MRVLSSDTVFLKGKKVTTPPFTLSVRLDIVLHKLPKLFPAVQYLTGISNWMQNTVPEVEGYYFIQITTMEEVSASTAFWRNYNALVTRNPKEKCKIDSPENSLCKISNYIYKKRRVSL